MKFSISFKYSNVTFKNKETKETIVYDTKASEGNTFTFDNVDEDVVIGMVKGIKDKKASQLFAYDDLRTNFINTMARNKCKELYDKLDKNEWKVEDVAVSNITIKDLEFTKPTMNARETLTVESRKMNESKYGDGPWPTWVVKERLVQLIKGVSKEHPMWADLIEILEKYYGEEAAEQVLESKKMNESIYDSNLDEALNLLNEAAASLHMAVFDIEDELGKDNELFKRVEKNYNDVHETYGIMEEFMDKGESEIMNESKEEVEVEFKKTPEDDGSSVIAFFPQTMHDGSCNPGNIMSYEHNGQHGEASIDFYHDCTNCLEEDYASLLHELEGIYDDCELVVVQK